MNPKEFRQALAQKIIDQLEAGTAPWIKPWDATLAPPGSPCNAVSGREYRGGNRLWLDCQGYVDPRWCTYKLATKQGWQVRKGEKSTLIEYWQWTQRQVDEQGQVREVKLDQPRVYFTRVFNIQQMEHAPKYQPPVLSWTPEEAAESILRASKATILHDKQDVAFYSPTKDEIHLPPPALFGTAIGYYATALHELGHWSGHPERLNRDLFNKFGTPDYAREELRAELASYFLASRLSIPHDPGQHAAYIGGWIDALRKDHNELFRAARDAERISEYVLEFQREKEREQGKQQGNKQAALPTLAVENMAKPAPTQITEVSSTKPKRARKPTREVELEC
jgi:antirestriction protein ArdC